MCQENNATHREYQIGPLRTFSSCAHSSIPFNAVLMLMPSCQWLLYSYHKHTLKWCVCKKDLISHYNSVWYSDSYRESCKYSYFLALKLIRSDFCLSMRSYSGGKFLHRDNGECYINKGSRLRQSFREDMWKIVHERFHGSAGSVFCIGMTMMEGKHISSHTWARVQNFRPRWYLHFFPHLFDSQLANSWTNKYLIIIMFVYEMYMPESYIHIYKWGT